MTKTPDNISKKKFMEEFRRYQKGSVTRRHFLNVTGLGAASAVMASARGWISSLGWFSDSC